MTPLNAVRCELGEGAFWHPARSEFFWFDITARTLHGLARSWTFADLVSAAGWIDRDRLIIASERALFTLNLDNGTRETLCALEAENTVTRSNDGRADPQGGFWIGTMGKSAQPQAGAIWRWHRGGLRKLYAGLTIPNAICFAPDGRSACFTDTETRQVMRVALDAAGWPTGAPECWLDLGPEGLNPDGAVFDAAGRFWVAQWGAGRVAAYAPDGQLVQSAAVPGVHASCPAFGRPALADLYCTTARQGLERPGPLDGATFRLAGVGKGLPEHQVHAA
jgi:sugar lactone lactonase YvrE